MSAQSLQVEPHKPGGGIVREIVLGINDGFVSILALVSGVAGAVADSRLVLIAGVAGTLAGIISMAAGVFISTRSYRDFYKSEMEREKREMREMPETEKREIQTIYHRKGFRGKLLSQIVKRITSNKRLWLKTMMEEELGLVKDQIPNPFYAAGVTGVAFAFASLFPLLPYVFLPVEDALPISVALTSIALFAAGAVKAHLFRLNKIEKGLEMLLIGLFAAGATYYIGTLFGV